MWIYYAFLRVRVQAVYLYVELLTAKYRTYKQSVARPRACQDIVKRFVINWITLICSFVCGCTRIYATAAATRIPAKCYNILAFWLNMIYLMIMYWGKQDYIYIKLIYFNY